MSRNDVVIVRMSADLFYAILEMDSLGNIDIAILGYS